METDEGLRSIEDIEVGDRVWSRDDETGEEDWRTVSEVFATPDRETLELTFEADDGSSEFFRVTPEHPFWSINDSEWDDAGSLELGEQVDSVRGPLTLISAMVSPVVETVYNFEVEDLHTYFVGEAGVWVHNACWKELLSVAQRARVDRIGEISHNWSVRQTLSGNMLDAGHVTKIREGVAGLSKARDALSRSLNNPTLQAEVRAGIQRSIDTASDLIRRGTSLIEGL